MRTIMRTILFTLLLLSIATDISVSAAVDYDLNNYKYDSQIENAMFEFYVNLYKYLSFSIRSTKSMFERVLQDQAIASNKSIEQQKDILETYIAEVNERLKPLPAEAVPLDGFLFIVARIYTVNLFADIVQKYNTTSLSTPSEEDVLIEGALKRNGLDELINQLKIRKTEFLNEFLNKMDIYVATLTEEDRQKNHKLVDWYDKYRTASDEEKSKDVFTNFMRLFARF